MLLCFQQRANLQRRMLAQMCHHLSSLIRMRETGSRFTLGLSKSQRVTRPHVSPHLWRHQLDEREMVSIEGVPEIIAVQRDHMGDSPGYERVGPVQIQNCITGGGRFVVEDSGLPVRHHQFRPYREGVVPPFETDGRAQRWNPW